MDKKYDWILTSSSSEYDTFGLAIYKNYTVKEIRQKLADHIAEEAKETNYAIYDATTDVKDIKVIQWPGEDPTDLTGHIDFDDFHYSYSMIRMDTVQAYENKRT